jgi:hypothetical protein
MRISVILAHPRKGSFNHAITQELVSTLGESGHKVSFHDLYAEQFDSLLPYPEIAHDAILPLQIEEHSREIASADGIVIVHPNWWGMPPAILKGWVDRVLRPGVAYRFSETDFGEGVRKGSLLHGRPLCSIPPIRPRCVSIKSSGIRSSGSGRIVYSHSAGLRNSTEGCLASLSRAPMIRERNGFSKYRIWPGTPFPLTLDPGDRCPPDPLSPPASCLLFPYPLPFRK